jgi:hypothetical protein
MPSVLANVSFTMSEKNPALRVTNAVADYYSLHINLRLHFNNRKQKKAVEHLVSVIKPAVLKAKIKSKLEMDKPDLKKDFLEFVAYLEKMSIIHDEHCHVLDHETTGDSGTKNTDDSGIKNTDKGGDAGGRSSGHNLGESTTGGGSIKTSERDRTNSGNERSSDSSSTG